MAESSLIQSTYPGVLTEEYFTGVGAISGAWSKMWVHGLLSLFWSSL